MAELEALFHRVKANWYGEEPISTQDMVSFVTISEEAANVSLEIGQIRHHYIQVLKMLEVEDEV